MRASSCCGRSRPIRRFMGRRASSLRGSPLRRQQRSFQWRRVRSCCRSMRRPVDGATRSTFRTSRPQHTPSPARSSSIATRRRGCAWPSRREACGGPVGGRPLSEDGARRSLMGARAARLMGGCVRPVRCCSSIRQMISRLTRIAACHNGERWQADAARRCCKARIPASRQGGLAACADRAAKSGRQRREARWPGVQRPLHCARGDGQQPGGGLARSRSD